MTITERFENGEIDFTPEEIQQIREELGGWAVDQIAKDQLEETAHRLSIAPIE